MAYGASFRDSSNATCLIRPRLLYALLFVLRIAILWLHESPPLKNTCVRQVVLDKRFPLNRRENIKRARRARADRTPLGKRGRGTEGLPDGEPAPAKNKAAGVKAPNATFISWKLTNRTTTNGATSASNSLVLRGGPLRSGSAVGEPV